MRYLLTLMFIFRIGLIFGQNFSYPNLPDVSKSIHDFIPKGWKILDSVSGDLNMDNQIDFVLVFQHIDSVRLINEDADTLITQPRILAILFQDNFQKRFRLKVQSNSFILNHDVPNMDDPFVGLKIDKNILSIEFKICYSWGSWWTSGATYKFRYNNNNDFDLIGFDSWNMHRASLENNIYSVNFLSGKYSITKEETIDEKIKSKTEWKTFKIKNLKTLKTFDKPFSWDFENEITI